MKSTRFLVSRSSVHYRCLVKAVQQSTVKPNQNFTVRYFHLPGDVNIHNEILLQVITSESCCVVWRITFAGLDKSEFAQWQKPNFAWFGATVAKIYGSRS